MQIDKPSKEVMNWANNMKLEKIMNKQDNDELIYLTGIQHGLISGILFSIFVGILIKLFI